VGGFIKTFLTSGCNVLLTPDVPHFFFHKSSAGQPSKTSTGIVQTFQNAVQNNVHGKEFKNPTVLKRANQMSPNDAIAVSCERLWNRIHAWYKYCG
jgi:hypothetical protein